MPLTVAGEINAPLAAVWAWWTDYGEVGVETKVGHGGLSSKRRVLHKEPGAVVIEDRWGPFRARRKLEIGEHVVVERNKQFRATWRFEAVGGDRTRVTRVIETKAPFARWMIQRDMDAHCRDAERDLVAITPSR